MAKWRCGAGGNARRGGGATLLAPWGEGRCVLAARSFGGRAGVVSIRASCDARLFLRAGGTGVTGVTAGSARTRSRDFTP